MLDMKCLSDDEAAVPVKARGIVYLGVGGDIRVRLHSGAIRVHESQYLGGLWSPVLRGGELVVAEGSWQMDGGDVVWAAEVTLPDGHSGQVLIDGLPDVVNLGELVVVGDMPLRLRGRYTGSPPVGEQ